ncbi:MAG: hypothetical protein FWK04_03535 [Nostoc sp. GBBB01]|nr:hypothetical protein [Nostoc sp. GBBB01]
MTKPFNEIANLLRQEEERKRLEAEKRGKEQEERQRIEEENEKFISLYEPMICRVLNQLGEILWSSSWQPRDIMTLQIDPGLTEYDGKLPYYMEDVTTQISMQKINGKIIRCQYLYDRVCKYCEIYAVGFQQIENQLIDSLVIASGTLNEEYTLDDYMGDGDNDFYLVTYPKLNAEKLVSANEDCLVEALTEIVKSRYKL